MVGGCTTVIDQEGEVRYMIAKGVASKERLDRQAKAMRGPLKDFWMRTKTGGKHRFTAKQGIFLRIHGGEPS